MYGGNVLLSGCVSFRCPGDEVTTFYDPMIAKLVVWDKDRGTALRKLNQALSDYQVCPLHLYMQ